MRNYFIRLLYNVGINKDATSHVYTAVVYATDIAGNSSTLLATGTTVQATDNVGPAISATMLTPTSMSALGGTMYFTATVTDEGGTNTGVNTVQATIYQNGLNYSLLTLSNGGSGSLYVGEVNIPVNKSQTPYKYSALINAVDTVGNRTYLPANGICNQVTSITSGILSPNITYPEVGPKALTSLGGDIVFTAKVTSPVGIYDVNAQIFDNGVYYTTVGLTRQNDDITFIGRFSVPINSDLYAHIWTVAIYSNDNTGNQTSQIAVGSCVEATDSGNPTQMIPAPTITSFTPTSAGPDMQVTITGTNFIGVTSVLFDGNMAQSYIVESETTIKAIIAANTTSGLITVTTMGGIAESANPFTYVGPVSISGISPTIGGVGTVVNITGVNFDTTTGVTINGTAAAFTVVSPTSINATVAAGTTTGPIVVTTLGGTASSAPFTFVPAPTITSFTPTTGPLGQLVTITGTNLSTATAVKFNGVNAASFTAVSNTSITATVAVGTTTGKITVITLGGTKVSTSNFTFIPAPTITSFTPSVGEIGTVVAITGTAFTGATSVKFNGIAATTFTVVNATTINATVAAGTTTGPITVTTPGGVGTSVNNFNFVLKPTVSFFTPATGGAGTVITIIGTNLSTTTAVKVGGVSITYNVVNDSVVTATISNSTVTGSVAVTTLAGTATSATPFTLIPAPTITSFTPITGISGTTITITGTEFTTATSVKIGGVAVLYTVVDSTTINAVASASALSGNIVVTTHGGTATSANEFTFIPEITSFTPTAAVVGKVVTIIGKHFTGASVVTFNGVTATFTLVNSTTITATVPVDATTGILEVVAPGGMAISANNFTVIPTLSAVVLNTLPINSAALGTPVTLTATTTGGANVQYQFMVGTTILRSYSNSSTYTFTPALLKTYTFTVIAKDLGGLVPTATVQSGPVSLIIKPALTAVSLKTTPTSSGMLGFPVTLTATVTGGANVRYKFMDGATQLRGYETGNTFTLTPTEAKTYTFTVVTCDLNSVAPTATKTADVSFIVKPPLSAVSLSTIPLNSAAVGTPVTLTATAIGGLNVQYQFMAGTTILRSYSSSNSYTFTPALLKTYIFTVIAKDLGGLVPTATVQSDPVNLVIKPVLTAVSLKTLPLSSAALGTPVTLTATATGGADVQYQFMTGTTILRSYSSSNSYTFTPAVLKTYTFTVIAKDLGGLVPTATVQSDPVSLTIKPALTAVSLKTTPTSSGLLGLPVTLTATVTGGANVQYKFMNGATQLRGYEAGNTFTFTPTEAKTYTFTVITCDLNSVDPTATMTADVSFIVKPPLSAVSLSTTPLNTAALGTPVTLNATAIGGVNVQYQFMTGTTILRSFNSSNTYTFTPSLLKTYSFTVIAKDLGGLVPTATVTSPVVTLVIKPALTAVSLSPTTLDTTAVGIPVTLIATATGGANVQYKFMDGSTQLRGYESGNTFNFTPTEVKTYSFTVIACDLNSADPTATKTSQTVTLVTKPVLSAVTIGADNASPWAGSPVTFTATATGGASVQYQFLLDGNTASPLRDFAAENTCQWISVGGTHVITVVARDINGIPGATVVADKTLTVKVALASVSLSTTPLNTAVLGTPVTLNATATGGVNVQYQFMTGTTILRSFNSSNTYTFTPALLKTYSFTVIAKDLGGLVPTTTVTSTPVTVAITAQ